MRWAVATLVGVLWGCSECKEDFDCPGTQVCNLSAGQCEAFVCARDRDCPPAHACRKNACRARTSAPAAPEVPDALVLRPPG